MTARASRGVRERAFVAVRETRISTRGMAYLVDWRGNAGKLDS